MHAAPREPISFDFKIKDLTDLLSYYVCLTVY